MKYKKAKIKHKRNKKEKGICYLKIGDNKIKYKECKMSLFLKDPVILLEITPIVYFYILNINKKTNVVIEVIKETNSYTNRMIFYNTNIIYSEFDLIKIECYKNNEGDYGETEIVNKPLWKRFLKMIA
jgi:hypothetical protein